MDSKKLSELLGEILQRLDIIEDKIQNIAPPPHTIACSRHESLESHRVAYNRQNGYPACVVIPTNPEAEDEID